MDTIAELSLIAERPGGGPVPVHLRLGNPRLRPEGDWASPVQAEGLRIWQGPSEIVGLDESNAMILGMLFLREQLRHEVRRGTIFRLEVGGEAVDVDRIYSIHTDAGLEWIRSDV